ncbi:MAG: hypothetical protein ABH851_08985 [Methanobacteriota archaeon]
MNSGGTRFTRLFERLIFLLAFITPLTNVPQLLKIWVHKNAAGVSAISWTLFSILSVFWFVYAVLKKDRTLTIMFFLLMIIQAAIALGAILYG